MRSRFSIVALASLVTVGAFALHYDDASAQDGAAAQPGDLQRPVNLSPEEMSKRADAIVGRVELGATTVRRMLEKARSERDVVKTLCLSDKLNQLDSTVGSARERKQALDAAIARKDNDLSAHEFTIMGVYRQRSDRLLSEANQCIGSDLGVIGDTRTTQTIDPGIPDDQVGLPPGPAIPLPVPPIPVSAAQLRREIDEPPVSRARSTLRSGVFAVSLAVGFFGVRSAAADEVAKPVSNEVWVRDARFQRGPGFVGERYIISPWVGVGLEYDSNIFLRSGNRSIEGEAPKVDTFRLALTPFIGIQPRGDLKGRSYALYFSAGATYYEYFQAFTKPGPGDDLKAHRNAAVTGNAKIVFAPGTRFSGDIHGGVARSVQPGNLGDPSAAYNRTTPFAGAGVSWSPGGGLFTWAAGYDLAFTFFDEARYKTLNNTAHSVSTTATWRFLPRTSVFTDARATIFQYASPEASTQSGGSSVSAKAGLNGLVTNGFGFLVAGGWSSTFFDTKGASTGDYDSFIAQVEGRFYLAPPPVDKDQPGAYPSMLSLGYLRDWQQSYIGNYFQRDRAYGNLGYFLGGRWFATLGGGFARLHFPQTIFPDGTLRNAPFNNYAADVQGALEFRPTSHVGISSTVAYTQMLSDTKLRTDAGNPALVDDQAYSRLTAMLGLRYLF